MTVTQTRRMVERAQIGRVKESIGQYKAAKTAANRAIVSRHIQSVRESQRDLSVGNEKKARGAKALRQTALAASRAQNAARHRPPGSPAGGQFY